MKKGKGLRSEEDNFDYKLKKPTYQTHGLPQDLIVEILLWLPAASLARFKCVCKSWSSLTYDPSFAHEYCRRNRVKKSIIFQKYQHGSLIRISRIRLDGELINEFPWKKCGIGMRKLSNFANGLTCLYDYRSSSIYLLNPTTKESAMLPANNPYNDYSFELGLGFSPYTREYKVVRQDVKIGSAMTVVWEILTLGGCNEWRSIKQVPHEAANCDLFVHSPVFLHGVLYWGSVDHVVSFDVNEEKIGFISSPTPLYPPDQLYTKVFELDAHLGFVSFDLYGFVNKNTTSSVVEIWKLEDYANKIWIKAYTMDPPSQRSPPARPVTKHFEFWRWFVGFHDGNFIVYIRGRGLCSYDPQKKTHTELGYRDNMAWVF